MKNIVKQYGGVYALKDGCIRLEKGQIHALMGENGAGKSTMMKVLSGAIQRDGGEIYIDGAAVDINSPLDSKRLGISIVYQEFVLAPDLTVAENIYIDHLTGTRGTLINWRSLNRKAQLLLDSLSFSNIKAGTQVGRLSVAYQQVVEICKSLSRNTKVLVLDEPTAVLTFNEIEKLFELLETLKRQGVCIVYVSHRMEEIFRICDKVTILKDGEFIGEHNIADITKEQLINSMVGRELKDLFPRGERIEPGGEVLRVENLSSGAMVNNVSFSLREGEVLGVYGLVGAGRTEAMQAVYGAAKRDGGTVAFRGKPAAFKSPGHAVRAGLGMLPEDRKAQGVLLKQSIRVNTTISRMGAVCNTGGFLKKRQEAKMVRELLDELSVRYADIENDVSSLSGGNQQKVSIAKWLFSQCSCIIFDEPTRGVDVGAKVEIYKIINKLVTQGVGVIVISSEMLEIIGICDRVVVMQGGAVTGELSGGDITESNLIRLAMGIQSC